jgi:hypothetical protein
VGRTPGPRPTPPSAFAWSSALLNDRPPIVAHLSVTAPGSDSPLTLRFLVNHLRSLGSIDQPGIANGARVRSKRNEQAKYVANLISGSSTDNSTNWNALENLVLVGDFNAFQFSDGYTDSMNCISGNSDPASQLYPFNPPAGPACAAITTPLMTNLTNADPAARYSYSFSGTAQTLDHVLVNANLAPRVRQLIVARNNADFAEGSTYRNDFNRPERVSDHDWPVLYLTLPVEVTSRTALNATAPFLNRATGRYNSTISVRNTGATSLTGPIYVFFYNLPSGVTLPDLPTSKGIPYLAINVPGGLAPGETSPTAVASFADPSDMPITYTTKRFDGTF